MTDQPANPAAAEIDFVIPVLNERETLAPLAEGILAHTQGYRCRICFIDDGSSDGSFEELQRLRKVHPEIEIIKFRRNFGKSQALAAGFARARGAIVFTMDADLQDDPAEIPKFLAKLEEGFDLVIGWKAVRQDPWHKTLPSKVYNRGISRMFDLPLHDVNSGFKAMRAEVVQRLVLYGERHRLIPVFAAHLGYHIGEIPVQHHPRRYGHSKYGWDRFIKGAVDVFAVRFIKLHGESPGHFFGRLALLYGAVSIAFLLGSTAGLGWTLVRWMQEEPVTTTALVSYLLLITSLLLGTLSALHGGLGLISEMLIRRLPPPDPSLYIESVEGPEA
ncbi:MAG: glycosyltransferase family 2 protein [Candidatus Hydrogenedentes bacterium]|nr:glycosyltransferase family 2 protein [Candidatus Hydrogenedentota bacterium]